MKSHPTSALAGFLLLIATFMLAAGCTAPGIGGGDGPEQENPVRHSKTVPEQFRGTWTWHKDGIHPEGGEGPRVISASSLSGHESRSVVKSVELRSKNEIVVTEEVTAEGSTYVETSNYKLSPDGQTLTIEDAEGLKVTLYRVKGG